MKPNIYIYILVMAGVTYLIRMLPLALFKKEITSPFVKSFLYYVTICLSGSDDLSGYPYSNSRRHPVRAGRTYCSPDRGIQRKKSSHSSAVCLCSSVCDRADHGIYDVKEEMYSKKDTFCIICGSFVD